MLNQRIPQIFTLSPESFNVFIYAINNKKSIFEWKMLFVTATGFKPVTG